MFQKSKPQLGSNTLGIKFLNFIDLTYFSRAKDGGAIDENTGKMSKNSWIRDYF